MTEVELNRVRELNGVIKDCERQLQTLREVRQSTVAIIDGQPRSRSAESRVELLTIMIVEGEKEVERMREEMRSAGESLKRELRKYGLTSQEWQVMILRYVACMRFRDIGFRMHLSDSRVFHWHRCGLKKVTNDSKAAVAKQ